MMRVRGVVPIVAAVAVIALLGGAGLQASTRLITEAENMRLADRTEMTNAKARTFDVMMLAVFDILDRSVTSPPLSASLGEPTDLAVYDRILEGGQFVTVQVFDPVGELVVTAGDAAHGIDVTDPAMQDFLQAARVGPAVSPVLRRAGDPGLAYGLPIRGPDGHLGAAVMSSHLTGTAGYAFMVANSDDDGRRLSEGRFLLLDGNDVIAASEDPALIGHTFEPAPEEQVLVRAPIALSGLSIVYHEPVSSFYGSIRQEHGQSNRLMLAMATLFALLLSVVMLRRHSVVVRAERRLSALFANAVDAVVVLRDGGVTYATPTTVEILGRSPDEMRSADHTELWADDGSTERYEELLEEAAREPGTDVRAELSLIHGDGGRRDAQVTAKDLSDDASVRGIVVTIQDVTERKALEREIIFRSLHDPHTGLANRSLFADRLDHAVARAARTGASFGVLFVDLDRFKPINDRLGHQAGDLVLQVIAERLKDGSRAVDTVARMGGDEFAILVEGIDQRAALGDLAQRLVDAVHQPIDTGEESVSVGASIGIAMATGAGADSESLLRAADLAMYAAKEAATGVAYANDESAVHF